MAYKWACTFGNLAERPAGPRRRRARVAHGLLSRAHGGLRHGVGFRRLRRDGGRVCGGHWRGGARRGTRPCTSLATTSAWCSRSVHALSILVLILGVLIIDDTGRKGAPRASCSLCRHPSRCSSRSICQRVPVRPRPARSARLKVPFMMSCMALVMITFIAVGSQYRVPSTSCMWDSMLGSSLADKRGGPACRRHQQVFQAHPAPSQAWAR